MPSVFFLISLLVGGMKKFTDVDHQTSFPLIRFAGT
jgi:hypothetical protein